MEYSNLELMVLRGTKLELRDLVKIFLSENDLKQIVNGECSISDSNNGKKIDCKKYNVFVKVAKVGSNNWIDVEARVANCNELQCIKEALEVAGKISLRIEENIFEILIPQNTEEYTGRLISRLRRLFSNVSISVNAFTFIGVQISGQQTSRGGTTHTETSKEQPGMLTVKMGPFTRIIVVFREQGRSRPR